MIMEFYKVFTLLALLPLLVSCEINTEQYPSCNSTIRADVYYIASPNYPNAYPKNEDCIFTLRQSRWHKCEPVFYLHIFDFDLTKSENCTEEYLLIDDDYIYCGKTIPSSKKYYGKDGAVKMVFHPSEEEKGRRGFRMVVFVECATSEEISAKNNGTEIYTESDAVHARFDAERNEIEYEDLEMSNPIEEADKSFSTIQFPDDHNNRIKNRIASSERRFDLGQPKIEKLAQIINPNCNKPFIGLNQQQNYQENSKIYSTISGQNQGPYNNYYPNQNPNFYSSYPNSYYPNSYYPNSYYPNNYYPSNNYPNNFIPVNPSYNPNLYPNSNPYPYPGYGFPSIDGINNNYPFLSGSECCSTVYSSARFLLASPDFPNIGNNLVPYDCGYTIQKSSPRVCQLRLNFKFFNLGSEDPFCNNGHLEIEGQKFCGCRTGLSVVSPFNNLLSKRLNVRYVGIPRSKFSGFLIDVIQENCNYNYNYRFKKDISEEDEGKEKRQIGYNYAVPEREFLEGSVTNQQFLLGTNERNNFVSACQSRVFFDWLLTSKEVFLRNAKCSPGSQFARNPAIPFAKVVASDKIDESEFSDDEDCEIINTVEGTLSSPQYPARYADNVYKCYRFTKQQDKCRLYITFFDFDLEVSRDCLNDFVQVDGQTERYCGQTLIGQQLHIDFSKANFAQMIFKSDSESNGRGWSMIYQQVDC